jgi:prepilin-type N-terminal cleavage/methylation domain-containing protein
MKPRTPRPAGFTLVEILMVILIIGMLITLLTVAAGFAIKAARRAAIKVEISNIEAAMQSLSTKLGGEYPPCMAPQVASATPDRVTQFNRMLRKRFPRSTQDYTAANTIFASTWGPVRGGMNLSLNTMDAAEALVFWLAGPPAPTSVGSSTILYGFSGNATSPFAPTGSRESSLFGFDEARLTDADNDGWPEYTPPGVTAMVNVAPYVYFDAANYQYSASGTTYVPCYPGSAFPITGGAPNSPFTAAWGYAVPYADNTTPSVTAWNPKKFQIICAGLDSEYGAGPSDGGTRPSLPVVPKTGSTAVQVLLQGDWDNQVNFIDTVLEDQIGQ